MTDPKENLLPCPFCGSPGVIIENIGRSKGESKKHHAGCDNPKCDMYGGLCSWHHKREDTIAAWNRRVTPELAQRVIELEAENARLRETVVEWNEVGEAIMRAVVGREVPLSDSDVIGEMARLRYENARLRAVAQAAKLFTSKLQNCLDAQTCNINECYICEHDYEPSIEALKQALTAAGYGGEG